MSASLSDWAGAIEAIRAAYKAPGDEARHPGQDLRPDSRANGCGSCPPYRPAARLFGAKSITGSFADGLRVSYLISLFDKDTADLVALVDGNRVTGLRTAATTAVGTSTIVPQRPLIVGVIGSGFEARSHLTAFSHVLEFADIRVFSPTQPTARPLPPSSTARSARPHELSSSAQRGRGRRRSDPVRRTLARRVPDAAGRMGRPERHGRLHRLDHARPARTARGAHRPRRGRRRGHRRRGRARQRGHDRGPGRGRRCRFARRHPQ